MKIKKPILIIMIMALLAFPLPVFGETFSLQGEIANDTNVEFLLETHRDNLIEGESLLLSTRFIDQRGCYCYLPKNHLLWEISDPTVAEIFNDGISNYIRGLQPGTTKIRCIYNGPRTISVSKRYFCETVKQYCYAGYDINLPDKEYSAEIEITVLPADNYRAYLLNECGCVGERLMMRPGETYTILAQKRVGDTLIVEDVVTSITPASRDGRDISYAEHISYSDYDNNSQEHEDIRMMWNWLCSGVKIKGNIIDTTEVDCRYAMTRDLQALVIFKDGTSQRITIDVCDEHYYFYTPPAEVTTSTLQIYEELRNMAWFLHTRHITGDFNYLLGAIDAKLIADAYDESYLAKFNNIKSALQNQDFATTELLLKELNAEFEVICSAKLREEIGHHLSIIANKLGIDEECDNSPDGLIAFSDKVSRTILKQGDTHSWSDRLTYSLKIKSWEEAARYDVLRVRDELDISYPRIYNVSPASGYPGTEVTIKGDDMSYVDKVMFGNVPALILERDGDTKITAIVPEGTGKVNVTIAEKYGEPSGIFGPYTAFTYVPKDIEPTKPATPIYSGRSSSYESTKTTKDETEPLQEDIIAKQIPEPEIPVFEPVVLELVNCLIENNHALIKTVDLEQYGIIVGWEEATRHIMIMYKDTQIILSPDSPEFMVNGQSYTLPIPVKIIEGRSYVPLRVIAENLGFTVGYDNETRQITIH